MRIKLRSLIAWVPSLFLAAGFGVIVSLYGLPRHPPEPFEPLAVNRVVFVTQPPFTQGQSITITNGLCNNSKKTVQATIAAGIREVEADPLTADRVVLLPQPGKPNDPQPLAPGCVGSKPITGPLPEAVHPGKWVIYESVIVTGERMEDVQRISVLSDEFEVRGP